uniref:phage tail tip fiber protein n=1 Tax=Pectobacterium cacticida TaxID=69221 RepID=UPI003987816C
MINGLRSDTDDNSVAITDLSETVTGQGSSQASVKQSLDAQARAQIQDALNGAEEAQRRRENVARITAEQTVIADEQQSLARELRQFETEFNSDIAETNALLQQESQTRSTADAALSQQTDALSARLSNAESDIAGTSDALDATQTTVTQQGNKITAQGTQINQIASSVNTAQSTANAAANAAAAAQSTANGAVQSINSVQTTVTQQGNKITAQGTQINSLTATVNGVSAEISDVSSVVGSMDAKMSAYRSIKVAVDANGRQYIAGIGLDVSNSQDGMQSNIILLADRTSIMTNAGGVPTPIFTTQGTQAILRSAVIGDLTVTSAKIAHGAIGRLQIADSIQSDNYVQSSTGMKIDFANGTFEINGRTPREGRMTQSNNRIEVYDENNVLRVLIGKYD